MTTLYSVAKKDDIQGILDIQAHACLTHATEVVKNNGNNCLVFTLDLNGMLESGGTKHGPHYKRHLTQIGYQHILGTPGFPTVSDFLRKRIIQFDLELVDNAQFNGFISAIRVPRECPEMFKKYYVSEWSKRYTERKLNALQIEAKYIMDEKKSGHMHYGFRTKLGNLYALGRRFPKSEKGYTNHRGQNENYYARTDKRFKTANVWINDATQEMKDRVLKTLGERL